MHRRCKNKKQQSTTYNDLNLNTGRATLSMRSILWYDLAYKGVSTILLVKIWMKNNSNQSTVGKACKNKKQQSTTYKVYLAWSSSLYQCCDDLAKNIQLDKAISNANWQSNLCQCEGQCQSQLRKIKENLFVKKLEINQQSASGQSGKTREKQAPSSMMIWPSLEVSSKWKQKQRHSGNLAMVLAAMLQIKRKNNQPLKTPLGLQQAVRKRGTTKQSSSMMILIMQSSDGSFFWFLCLYQVPVPGTVGPTYQISWPTALQLSQFCRICTWYLSIIVY